MGGGVQRCETKLKQFIFGIGTFFCPKLGEESLHWIWSSFLPEVSEDQKNRSLSRLGSSFSTNFSSSPESK